MQTAELHKAKVDHHLEDAREEQPMPATAASQPLPPAAAAEVTPVPATAVVPTAGSNEPGTEESMPTPRSKSKAPHADRDPSIQAANQETDDTHDVTKAQGRPQAVDMNPSSPPQARKPSIPVALPQSLDMSPAKKPSLSRTTTGATLAPTSPGLLSREGTGLSTPRPLSVARKASNESLLLQVWAPPVIPYIALVYS